MPTMQAGFSHDEHVEFYSMQIAFAVMECLGTV